MYDVLTTPANIHPKILELIPDLGRDESKSYWRRVLRIAALCHDLGHLPFSHAAEKDLLPHGWDHERITVDIIRSKEMQEIWDAMIPPLRSEHIVKIAVGPKKLTQEKFSDWEAILSEIIVGDAFGVDRMDYLLRDSHHAGVAYGKFDHYRLIDTLRILPREEHGSLEPSLGVEEGGVHSAEALLLARYFMYMQLYLHPVRRVYDIHLKDFLKEWLKEGKFGTSVDKHLEMTDNEVTSAILKAARNSGLKGHDPARRIVNREHFRMLYQRNPNDVAKNPEAGKAIFEAACDKFGSDLVRYDAYKPKGTGIDFGVLARDERIISSLALSDTLKNLPVPAIEFVFVSPVYRKEAHHWLEESRDAIIEIKGEDINE